MKNKFLIVMVVIVSLNQVISASDDLCLMNYCSHHSIEKYLKNNERNEWFITIPADTTDSQKIIFLKAALDHAKNTLAIECKQKSFNPHRYFQMQEYLFGRAQRIDDDGFKRHLNQGQEEYSTHEAAYNWTFAAVSHLLVDYQNLVNYQNNELELSRTMLSRTIENEMTQDEMQAAVKKIVEKHRNLNGSEESSYSLEQDNRILHEVLEYHRSQKSLQQNASGESSSSSSK